MCVFLTYVIRNFANILPCFNICPTLLPHADASSQHKCLLEHIQKLRSVRGQEEAQVVVIPESNLGFEAQHAVAALQRARTPKWVALAEGANGTVGLHTTHETKAAMCKATQELLDFDSLSISASLVSVSQEPHEATKQLLEELRNYSVIIEPAKGVFGKPKHTFSGKIGGQQDDLAIALQLCIIGSKIFARSEKYSSFRD